MITIAIDLGSRRCGMVAGYAAPSLVRASVVDVDPGNLDAAAQVILGRIRQALAEGIPVRVVLEHGPLYMPADVTPQAAQKIALAWHACENLRLLVDAGATALGATIVTRRGEDGSEKRSVPRQTWASRLVTGHRGGISQSEARAAVRAHLDAASLDLIRQASAGLRDDDDAIDAAGVWLWAVLPPRSAGKRVRRRGERFVGPRLPKGMRRVLRMRARRQANEERRAAAGCRCGEGHPKHGGRHRAGCALAPPAAVRGYSPDAVERARKALAGFLPRKRGEEAA